MNYIIVWIHAQKPRMLALSECGLIVNHFFLTSHLQDRAQFKNIINTNMRTNDDSKEIISSENRLNIKEPEIEPPKFNISTLFRFTEPKDFLLMILGSLGSIGTGIVVPLITYYLSQLSSVFGQEDNDYKKEKGKQYFLYFIYIGISGLISGWAMVTFWLITGERQASKCRRSYYEALMRQDLSFYDCQDQSQIHTQFIVDSLSFQSAIGEKLAIIIQIIGGFVTTIVISFIQGWLVTLFMIGLTPLLLATTYFNMRTIQQKERKFQQAYSVVGGKAEESISSIKTVKQLNAEQFSSNIYESSLGSATSKKKSYIKRIALSFAFLNFSIFIVYSLGLWFLTNCVIGSKICPTQVSGKYYTAADSLSIFFNFVVSCFGLSIFSPALKKVSMGLQAAKRIYSIIDRVPKISKNTEGVKLEGLKGTVEFKNVTFSYPKAPEKAVLRNFSLRCDGRSSALVGESGSGKSTIAQLLMRFYDPEEGQIFIDGCDVRDFDLQWLRSKIGYVGQEPVLFAATIRENLLYANPSASEEEIKEALRQAEIYDFIYSHLEKNIDTYVGVGGSQLSGGQKQRIAIARALIKRPKLLIFDEATSALDRTNERLIQETLDRIAQKVTTITIAHRVTTILKCDKVYVIKECKLEESGPIGELLYFKKKAQINQTVRLISSQKQATSGDGQPIKNPEKQQGIQSKPIKQFVKVSNVDQNSQLIKRHDSGMSSRILTFCRQKKSFLLASFSFSILLGIFFPIFSAYVGLAIKSIHNLAKNKDDQNELKQANMSSIVFIIIGIGAFIIYYVQVYLGYLAGDEITENLRKEVFAKILKMPIKWFDRKSNMSGSLGVRLSTSAEIVNEVVTTYIFILIQSLTTFVAGFGIAFYFCWRITFVAVAVFPLMVISGMVRAKFKVGLTQKIDQMHKQTSGDIAQSILHIRTVYAFSMDLSFINKYDNCLKKSYDSLVKTGVITGMMNGIGSVSINIMLGLLLYFGMIFVVDYNVQVDGLITAIFTCILISNSLGSNMNFMPDVAQGRLSAAKLFDILDEEDEQQMQQREQSPMVKEGGMGSIRFEGVSFKYEDRQEFVFRNLSFELQEGQKTAFVGASGCGKSTIIQLLLRFYEPTQGAIYLGGRNIKDYDLGYLRSLFGVVSQQPTVFRCSFRENIRYNSVATDEEVREAARKANALSFIEAQAELQEAEGTASGFDREVLVKGLNISGGQKQRLAIARAILRNPRILLLDEATSALDAENERIVQESLDEAMKGRTTITVAHRMQTIENSDCIIVIDKGSIVEKGKFSQLKVKQGIFFQLLNGNVK